MPEFVTVASTNDIPPGEMTIVTLGDDEIVIANVNGDYVAFGNSCTHRGGPMGEGLLIGEIVECPFHGGQFNARTGAVVQAPPTEPLPTYEVRIEGEYIQVAAPGPSGAG